MKRALFKNLQSWAQKSNRKPLLLRGARQVGKTHIIRELAKTFFENIIEINFELAPEFNHAFSNLNAENIIAKIESVTGLTIKPGKTLLFLDEIQECPSAIASLRYFYEMIPDLHVIGAGSLLEFALREAKFSMPVGRVSFMFLEPLSFNEFIEAAGYEKLKDNINKSSLQKPLSDIEHEKSLALFQNYTQLGGMPNVLTEYFETKSFTEAHIAQAEILATYRRDFGKYASLTQHKYLQAIFNEAPKHLGQQIKYSKIDSNFRSRDLSQAIKDLQDAGLIKQVFSASGSGVPFLATINKKKFKLLFLDVGLAQNAGGLTPDIALNANIDMINKGNITEQVVGQEMIAYEDPRVEREIYFWARDGRSIAEVDYLIRLGNYIFPIEVKSGKSVKYKSLKLFMDEKHSPFGIVISSRPLELKGNILYLPFYMIQQIKPILTELLRHEG